MKDIKKQWAKLPSLVRIVIIIVMIIIAIYVLSYIKGYIEAKSSAAQSNAEENAYEDEGITASYNQSWYDTRANQLQDAMTVWSGTDETKIKKIFDELNNEMDALHLNRAFGQRDYTCYAFGTCTDGLRHWLKSDGVLSDVEQILEDRGINYAIK